MRNKWHVFIILIIFCSIPNMPSASKKSFNKSLCDFPFGQDGQFSAYYDQRNFDANYYFGSNPNGGIKLELFLGFFNNPKERDRLIKKIYWVRYTNKSSGTTYIITKPIKYLYLGRPTGEYQIWLGGEKSAIGNWVVNACTKSGTYTGTFEITEDMIDFQFPAKAVDPIVYEDTLTGALTVEALHTNGTFSRTRVFDKDENIVNQQDWSPALCSEASLPCFMNFNYPAATGETLRIETRIYNQDWPIMVPNELCKAYDMNPGGMSRSSIFLKLQTAEP